MRISNQRGEEIVSVDDWLLKAPPKRGDKQWKDYRSAKELAKSWFRSPPASPPRELMEFLQHSFPSRKVILTEAVPELVIPLDNYAGEHRNADLVISGALGSEKLLISVEAKADEAFGDQLVGAYFDARLAVPKSNVPARITGLVRALFGSDLEAEIRGLRYQLLHSAAATLIEAQKQGAHVAVFLVHEFLSSRLKPKNVQRNQCDWNSFVTKLFRNQAPPATTEPRMIGPLSVPGGGLVPSSIPLYVGKIQSRLT
jgi:hypothetical protein